MAKPTEFHPPGSRYNPDDVLCFQRAEANWQAFCNRINAEGQKRKPATDEDEALKQELAELF